MNGEQPTIVLIEIPAVGCFLLIAVAPTCASIAREIRKRLQ